MRKTYLLIAAGLVACSATEAPADTADTASGIPTATVTATATEGPGTTSSTGGNSGTGNQTTTPTSGTAAGTGDGPKFDVGDGGECQSKPAGIYCDGQRTYTCDGSGSVSATENCIPGYCVEGTGCVPCLEGQFDCVGAQVMECNTAVNPPVWQQIETCDPAAGEACSIELGTCAASAVIGDTTPTGEYYQFAYFANGSAFQGGYDVDGIDDKLYVTAFGGGIDVYQVELLDTDADGAFEPNQHPNNPDNTGPIEERTLTFVENIAYPGTISLSINELFLTPTQMYIGGNELTEFDLATATSNVVLNRPAWINRLAQIGFDEVYGHWYASTESRRQVIQYDPVSATWGIAFDFPNMSGDHMDGLEVVTDPNTGTPYVYVSDMTSDFIGQYRKDPQLGWVQENLFEYAGTEGSLVEGMGFGPINHFWATGGQDLYELGGGDLSDFIEPPG
jgi:hypothetical protein